MQVNHDATNPRRCCLEICKYRLRPLSLFRCHLLTKSHNNHKMHEIIIVFLSDKDILFTHTYYLLREENQHCFKNVRKHQSKYPLRSYRNVNTKIWTWYRNIERYWLANIRLEFNYFFMWYFICINIFLKRSFNEIIFYEFHLYFLLGK